MTGYEPLSLESETGDPKYLMEEGVAVEILGELPKPLDGLIKQVLHQALDARRQRFVVHISWPHADVIVHIKEPFDRRLKFTRPAEAEIGRELYATVTAIVDEEYGPVESA